MNHKLKIFLTVSVLLNLLLLGVISGLASRHLIGEDERYSLDEVAATLPADKREALLSAMQRLDQDTGEMHEQLSDAKKKALVILKAQPFDKEEYLAQLQRMNKMRDQIILRKAEAVAEIAPQMSPQDREKIIGLMRRPDHGQPATGK